MKSKGLTKSNWDEERWCLMNLTNKEKEILNYLVTTFSDHDKPIPFHEEDVRIESYSSEEIKNLVDGLYEKGLVFILQPENDEKGEAKDFEKQPFVVAPDAIHKDYY